MSIRFDSASKTFYLEGDRSTYAFRITERGFLEHLYYGAKIGHDDLTLLRVQGAASYSPMFPGTDEERGSFNGYSSMSCELSFPNTGDYREPTVKTCTERGDRTAEILYTGHEILSEKPRIEGMPSLRGGETLVVHTLDAATGLSCDLYYTGYENGGIARRIVYGNKGSEPLRLTRAYSFTLDLPPREFETVSLYGGWARERQIDREKLPHGIFSVESKRGTSSAILNPFLALVESDTTEEKGNAYAVNLIYSSSYQLKAERTENGHTLLLGGISDFDFEWELNPGDSFSTPEAVLVYSNEGLGGMSRVYHDLYRDHLIRPDLVYAHRPVVINNWEGTYFNFNNDKLKAIADAAAGTGIDTFVLDDGWFGKRDNDLSGLGDWVVNTQKMQGGLTEIIDHVHGLGMKFGLWFEPEMISEDSDLFRAHPDYAVGSLIRPNCVSRHQRMLDLTRKDVRDTIVNAVNDVLDHNAIDYVKWDYNRNLTEFYSQKLSPEEQKGFAHRYVLGVYDLFERIVMAHPKVFFEGCSGGGARFDGGVLAYFPQIWTSDDSDAEERTRIQYGTSLVYPLSAMSCHVSVVPNHQSHRVTPCRSRADIAHLGATGYELDTTVFTEADRDEVREQVAAYHAMEELVLHGDLYRTENPYEGNLFGFLLVSKDKKRAQLTAYRRMGRPNPEALHLKVCGLDPEKTYLVKELNASFKGSTLMEIGLPPRFGAGDYQTVVYTFEEA